MSKKILKRSLALGALMAFVITGSAWAESKTSTLTDNYEARYGIYKSTDFSGANGTFESYSNWNLGSYELWVTGISDHSAGVDSAIYITSGDSDKGYQFVGDADSKLKISKSDGTALDGMGLKVFGSVNVGTLEINVTKSAIYSHGVSTIVADNIKLTSVNGSTVYAEPDSTSNIVITPKKTLEITHQNNTNDEAAVRANSYSTITIASPENQKADIVINGKVDTLTDSTVVLKLETAKSKINGSINAYQRNTTQFQGTRNITLSNGATWTVTGESDVTTLEGNDANLVVTKLEEKFVTIKDDKTQQLTVSADASLLTGEDAADNLKKVAKTLSITGEDTGKNTAQITGDEVYDVISGEFDQNGDIKEETINKTVAATNLDINSAGTIGLMAWRAETNDMNKRLGELRNANGEHGVWVRMVRGEAEYKSVKNQYNQYQLGYDEKLSTDPSWTVGAALSYTDGESSYEKGNGENTHKGLAIYGSKLNDDGTFIDLIAKYSRLDHNFKAADAMGDGEYDTNGYSVSAEFGKRIQQGKGLWIEPQVELTYGKVSAVDYVTAKGVNVAQDGMESLVGRIGFSLGKDIEKGNVYARASYLYDFEGETDTVLNGQETLKEDFGGGWWEVGVGANINLSKATYIYADVEKTFGGEVDTNWQWNLGVRYSF